MTIAEAIKKVVEGLDLTLEEAEAVLEQIMSGAANEPQIAALLTALRMKGETVPEITGFARVMRRKATRIKAGTSVQEELGGTGRDALIDTCGTGGDVTGTFNISTATAFVAAAAGLRVAKHGNRSASSLCGSADVIEALGVKIELSPEQISRCIDEIGIGFLPAQLLHTAMKYVAPVRKQLGIRTIFNMLGPLTNPAGADCQVIGVYASELTETLAQVLRDLGSKHVLIVHGADGMDEITITGETRVAELVNTQIKSYTVRPEDFGVARLPLSTIQGGDARRNAEIILGVLKGQPGPCRDVVLMNAAAALVAGDKAADLKQGFTIATECIDSGRALNKLEQLVASTTSLAGQKSSSPGARITL